MDRKQFEENLLLHGADINQWPEEMRQSALEALESSSELQELQRDNDNFERFLRTRKYEEPTDNLARRIISVSLQRKQKAGLGSFVADLTNEFRIPRPALVAISITMILALTIGFAIGFTNLSGSSVLNNTEETNLQAFLFDEGDVI